MKKALVAGLLLTLSVISVSPQGAAADPVEGGDAASYGVTALIAGNELIPPTPAAAVSGLGDDQDEVTIPIDADPLLINGTLIARAAVHAASDIPSALEQEAAAQAVPGPYNAQGVGQAEDLEVLIDAVGDGVPLLEADLIRGEAVAVCNDGTVEYSASSEVVNLVIGGEDPLSGPLNDLITQITEALEPLADLVDIDVNVVETTATGATVDAIVVTVLAAAGDPVVELRIGHAEVSGVTCDTGGGGEPECSDGIDNDGDGLIDIEDPNCHTDGDPDNPDSFDPDDDSEAPECSNERDDDGDTLIDEADPGCHTDGDATDGDDTFNPDDDSELAQCQDGIDNDGDGFIDFPEDPDCTSADDESEFPDEVAGGDQSAPLPRTGMPIATGLAAALGAGALGLLALRRRSVA